MQEFNQEDDSSSSHQQTKQNATKTDTETIRSFRLPFPSFDAKLPRRQ